MERLEEISRELMDCYRMSRTKRARNRKQSREDKRGINRSPTEEKRSNERIHRHRGSDGVGDRQTHSETEPEAEADRKETDKRRVR